MTCRRWFLQKLFSNSLKRFWFMFIKAEFTVKSPGSRRFWRLLGKNMLKIMRCFYFVLPLIRPTLMKLLLQLMSLISHQSLQQDWSFNPISTLRQHLTVLSLRTQTTAAQSNSRSESVRHVELREHKHLGPKEASKTLTTRTPLDVTHLTVNWALTNTKLQESCFLHKQPQARTSRTNRFVL